VIQIKHRSFKREVALTTFAYRKKRLYPMLGSLFLDRSNWNVMLRIGKRQ